MTARSDEDRATAAGQRGMWHTWAPPAARAGAAPPPPAQYRRAYPGRHGGSLELLLGPVGARKSGALINAKRRWQVAKRRVLLVAYAPPGVAGGIPRDGPLDNRDGVHEAAVLSDTLVAMSTVLHLTCYDVLCVDEGQFFPDLLAGVSVWLAAGKPVVVGGIDSTYEGAPCDGQTVQLPGNILALVAWATTVTKLHAVCLACGAMDAAFSQRLPSAEGDGADLADKRHYEARCYRCFDPPRDEEAQ